MNNRQQINKELSKIKDKRSYKFKNFKDVWLRSKEKKII